MGLVNTEQVVQSGFRIEDDKLVCYEGGRKRKNWKNGFRHKSRKFLKDQCEECPNVSNLTIHHEIHLSTARSLEDLKELCKKENCVTLCIDCHKDEHYAPKITKRERLIRRAKIRDKRQAKASRKQKTRIIEFIPNIESDKHKFAERKLRRRKRKYQEINDIEESFKLRVEIGLWGEYRLVDI